MWADLARLRSQSAPEPIDSVALFSAPVAGVRSRTAAVIVLVALPFASNLLLSLVGELDWNFTFQKLIVLATWACLLSASYAALGTSRTSSTPSTSRTLRTLCTAVPLAALALYQLSPGSIPGWRSIVTRP